MKNLFGKKTKDSQSKNTLDPLKTIEELTTKIDHMEEKIRFIETRKKNLNEQAKIKLKAGDKNAARQALAKKKKYDDQIKQFDGAIMLMEEQKMMLEGAESMRAVLESIKKANTILASTQKGMNVEDIVNIKEELEVINYISITTRNTNTIKKNLLISLLNIQHKKIKKLRMNLIN